MTSPLSHDDVALNCLGTEVLNDRSTFTGDYVVTYVVSVDSTDGPSALHIEPPGPPTKP